jgi:DNA polymerase elongation subunit (family B)
MDKNIFELFLEGGDPQKYIVSVESTYYDNYVHLIIHDPKNGKFIEKHKFKPFLWMKKFDYKKLYKGNRKEITNKMKEYGIEIEELVHKDADGDTVDRLENGYIYIVHTTQSYSRLLDFFKKGGLNPTENRDIFLTIGTTEQYLIQTGKRLFKGMEDYDEVHRLTFDIETTGLFPENSRIFEIGIKDNRGFEEVIKMEDESQEISGIKRFFEVIDELKPAIICGYNSENFDWDFIIKRVQIHGERIESIASTLKYDSEIKRKKATLKMGAEMEYYEQTVMWGYNIMDIWHAVRRAAAINSNIKETGLKYITKFEKIAKTNRIYISHQSINDLWNSKDEYILNDVDGKYEKYENQTLNENQKIVTGEYLVTRYLLDDLWETEQIDYIYNQATFLLSKIVPSTLQRTSTMGTAALWKTLMLGWSYENGLAIPSYQPKRKFTGGLSRLIKVGYSERIVKFDYGSLYPSIQLTHNVFPNVDITEALKGFLQYIFDSRAFYKKKMKEAKKKGDDKKAKLFDRKQLPLKILNNSNFGSVSAPDVYPWGDTDVGEMITCTGRQYLRLMIKFFMEKGYDPIVGDTDGFNFIMPVDIDSHTYTTKGTHKNYKKGEVHTGVPADIAEFNELYMKGVMELNIDEYCESTINLARKNYANLIDGEVKIVGNTLKSNKLPVYIEEFIDVGVRHLLEGKGKEFLELYYEYIDKIFNKEISLIKIASKSKVKQTIDEYIKRTKETNIKGNPLPRQAHMELLIKENVKINLGDTVYYVNTGTKKSHGDVQTKKNKETGETELIFNCVLISKDSIDTVDTKSINYNVSKYIEAFNKRIEPLLVCFSPEIRDNILINDPEERTYFTEKQMELVAGIPNDPEDQDDLEKDVMNMEQSEIEFWERLEVDPNYMLNKKSTNQTV